MPLDVPQLTQGSLYLVIAIAIAILTIFLAVALIYLILVLRDSARILDKTRDTVEKVNAFVVKPIRLVSTIIEQTRPLIERAVKNASERRKKRRGS